MVDKSQFQEIFDSLESAGHSFYGLKLPDDVAWDILPVLYIRLFSYTSWQRIRSASIKATDEISGAALISEIDRSLSILSRQFDAACVLGELGYASAGIGWQYAKSLVESVSPIVSDEGIFLGTYEHFFQPMNEQIQSPLFSRDSYQFACDIAQSSGAVRTNDIVLCPNFGHLEFIEQARLRLHCKGIAGRDLEHQNAYFANLYAHTKGWVCSFKGGSILEDAPGENNANRPRKYRCAMGALPIGAGDEWVRASLQNLRDDGLAFILTQDEPRCLHSDTEPYARAVFRLKDCYLATYSRKPERDAFFRDLHEASLPNETMKEEISLFRELARTW